VAPAGLLPRREKQGGTAVVSGSFRFIFACPIAGGLVSGLESLTIAPLDRLGRYLVCQRGDKAPAKASP